MRVVRASWDFSVQADHVLTHRLWPALHSFRISSEMARRFSSMSHTQSICSGRRPSEPRAVTLDEYDGSGLPSPLHSRIEAWDAKAAVRSRTGHVHGPNRLCSTILSHFEDIGAACINELRTLGVAASSRSADRSLIGLPGAPPMRTGSNQRAGYLLTQQL